MASTPISSKAKKGRKTMSLLASQHADTHEGYETDESAQEKLTFRIIFWTWRHFFLAAEVLMFGNFNASGDCSCKNLLFRESATDPLNVSASATSPNDESDESEESFDKCLFLPLLRCAELPFSFLVTDQITTIWVWDLRFI